MPELSQQALDGQLQQRLAGRVCLLGLGNPDYGDDGLGVRLIEMLREAGVKNALIAGTTPEQYLGLLARAGVEHVVFLDAVEIGGSPGSVIFLGAAEIASRFPQVSTHKISLSLLAQWAEANGMKAWLLGVQPESLAQGRPLSASVQATLEALRDLLKELVPQTPVFADDAEVCLP
jgi:hydrogenase maturation protease